MISSSLSENSHQSFMKFSPSAGNVLPAKTGAPGENNCTQCHSGTVQSGSGVNDLTYSGGSSYSPSNTYTLDLSLTGGSNKNGFQIVALDGSNQMAGSWSVTDAANTTTQTSGGKSYLNHTGSGTGLTSWSFDWVAPSSDIGDITFYLATNITNNDFSTGGDDIYLSQLTISSGTSTGISYYNRLDNGLEIINQQDQVDFYLPLEAMANVKLKGFTTNGKLIESINFGKLPAGRQMITSEVNYDGVVIYNIFVNNNILYKKVFR